MAGASRREELRHLYYCWDIEGTGLEIGTMQPALSDLDIDASKKKILLDTLCSACEGQTVVPNWSCEQFEDFFSVLMQNLSATEFADIIGQLHDTIDFWKNLSEHNRKSNETWKLYVELDPDHTNQLKFDHLYSVFQGTRFFAANSVKWKMPLKFFKQQLAMEAEGQANPPPEGMTLQQFHSYMNRITLYLTESAFYECTKAVTNTIWSNRKEYTISKHMQQHQQPHPNATRNQDFDRAEAIGKLKRGATGSGFDEEEETPKDLNISVTRCLEVTREDNLKQTKIASLRQEMQHVFDSVNLEDVDKLLATLAPKVYMDIVSAAVCILLKIPPRSADLQGTDYYWWSALKYTMKKNLKDFLSCLHTFNTSTIELETLKRIMDFYWDPYFEPSRLLMHSWVLSGLCRWVKIVVELVCTENDWEFPMEPLHKGAAVSSNNLTAISLSAHAGRASGATATTFVTPKLATSRLTSPTAAKNKQTKVNTSPYYKGRMPILDNIFRRVPQHESLVELPENSPLMPEYSPPRNYRGPNTPRSGIMLGV